MSSNWGNQLKLSIFGESHGNGIGVVLDGLPAGIPIDQEEIFAQMARRAPGRDLSSTPRKEEDLPEILSGVRNGTLTGAPLAAVIRNLQRPFWGLRKSVGAAQAGPRRLYRIHPLSGR